MEFHFQAESIWGPETHCFHDFSLKPTHVVTSEKNQVFARNIEKSWFWVCWKANLISKDFCKDLIPFRCPEDPHLSRNDRVYSIRGKLVILPNSPLYKASKVPSYCFIVLSTASLHFSFLELQASITQSPALQLKFRHRHDIHTLLLSIHPLAIPSVSRLPTTNHNSVSYLRGKGSLPNWLCALLGSFPPHISNIRVRFHAFTFFWFSRLLVAVLGLFQLGVFLPFLGD